MPAFSFGNKVGIRFKDIMSGPFGLGETEPRAGHDKGGTTLAFELDLEIFGLLEFLRSDRKGVAVIGGKVDWTGQADNAPITEGVMIMFRKESATRSFFDFDFTFTDNQGRPVRFQGQKRLTDDFGLDAFGDLSTVFGTLSRDDQIVAAGITTVHLDELFRQMFSMHVVNARDSDEESEALDSFWRFYNTEISTIYPEIPMFFRAHDRLRASEWQTLALIAEVMLPKGRPTAGPSTRDVVDGLARFLTSASGEAIRRMRDLLAFFGDTITPAIAPQRESVRKFVEGVLLHGDHPALKEPLLTLHGVISLPYYSHEKADQITGHFRAKIRRRVDEGFPVVEPRNISEITNRIWDVVIIGSGPAGSVVADRLSARGKSGVILEAGPYVKEGVIDHDELTYSAKLFKQGGLQRANESSKPMTVLQGACVGGGAMVNNAVCFQMPDRRIKHWQSFGFPIDEATLRAAYARIAADLEIVSLRDSSRILNPTYHALKNAFGTPERSSSTDEGPRPGFHDCLVNIEKNDDGEHGCLGLGLCNIGCGAARKKNALQVYLPRTLERPNWRLVPDAEVTRLRINTFATPRFARSAEVRLANGDLVEVQAQHFVLAAGPVGSSVVLLRSDIGDGKKNVGKRFAANIGAPLFAFYDQKLRSALASPDLGPGTPIAHYFSPPTPANVDAGFVIETWFNPPGAQSLVLPGAFEEHFELMKKYAHCALAAPLIGTEAQGSIRIEHGETKIELPLGDVELGRLKRGLELLGKAFFQGGALPNGTPLMPNLVVGGLRGMPFRMHSAADVDRYLDALKSMDDLFLGTGHPQGGNAMSTHDAVGVIGADFTVRGVRNVRVCDGSIFPASAAVNPQWTIMALADLCARSIG